MERYSIQTFTSAWSRYYAASIKGSWIPNMGTWLRGAWHPSTNVLIDGVIINPSPMFLLVQERTREAALSVEIHYKTALPPSWVQEIKNGFRQDFPVYEFDDDKECTIIVPAHSDPETIYMLPGNNIYQIDSVVVTGGAGRDQEKFSILALASPSPRILYGLGANDLEQNLLRVKRGLFPQPEFCMTCMGTKEYPEGVTCPECEGYGFAGPNAVYPLLDFHGRNVSLPRYGLEADEEYGRRIWARKWNLIPTKSEIERYFTHFMHVMNPLDLLVWEHPDDDEPLFWVAAYYDGLGSKALWHQGDANQDYDGMVERACPAGVNGYFAWLFPGFDGNADELVVSDESSSQEWNLNDEDYGPQWQGSEWNEALWEEFDDWCSENLLDNFEEYEDEDDIATEDPVKWDLVDGTFKRTITLPAMGELKGEVIGTFPVISGVVFDDYRVKFDAVFDGSAETYKMKVGIAEDGNTDDEDLNIRIVFKNSDKLIYSKGIPSVPESGIEKFTYGDATDLDNKSDFAAGSALASVSNFTSDGKYTFKVYSNKAKMNRTSAGAYTNYPQLKFKTTTTTYPCTVELKVTPSQDDHRETIYVADDNAVLTNFGAFDFSEEGRFRVYGYGYGWHDEHAYVAATEYTILVTFHSTTSYSVGFLEHTFGPYTTAGTLANVGSLWIAPGVMGAVTSIFNYDDIKQEVDEISTGIYWNTGVSSCDATFEISVVDSDKFRVRKNEEEWSRELDCKNAFTAGIKHLKLETTDAAGIKVDDIIYSW